MGDTPLHPPHSQSRPLRKAAGPYPMAWVLLFTAAGVAVARYATLPAGFLAAAFAAATLMAFITYRRRIGNGYTRGARQFLDVFRTGLFVPMHFVASGFESAWRMKEFTDAKSVPFWCIRREGECCEVKEIIAQASR